MTSLEIKEFAAKVIREQFASAGISIKQILLFGSRSRGEAGPDSDWDFLVSTGVDLEFGAKAKLTTAIQRRLAEKRISVDVIVKSENRIEQERNNVGVITYYAMKDGVLI